MAIMNGWLRLGCNLRIIGVIFISFISFMIYIQPWLHSLLRGNSGVVLIQLLLQEDLDKLTASKRPAHSEATGNQLLLWKSTVLHHHGYSLPIVQSSWIQISHPDAKHVGTEHLIPLVRGNNAWTSHNPKWVSLLKPMNFFGIPVIVTRIEEELEE